MTTLRQRRESTDEKANRLLAEGRLTVTLVADGVILSQCRGDSATYGQSYVDGHWGCTCPARVDCSHLRALWRVTVNWSKR